MGDMPGGRDYCENRGCSMPCARKESMSWTAADHAGCARLSKNWDDIQLLTQAAAMVDVAFYT